MELTSHDRKVVDDFVQRVQQLSGNAPFAVVLIGSTARGTQSQQSDLDLLVVTDTDVILPRHHLPPLHVQALTKGAFLDRLAKGDDFVAWSLRFGKPIRGAHYWNKVLRSQPNRNWPQ